MGMDIIRIDLEGVNAYLLKDGSSFVLVDTGGPLFYKKFNDCSQLLENRLNELGCTPDNLKLLVLTHGDIDHVFNAAYIKEKYNVPIAIHSKDARLVASPSIEKVLENCKYRSFIYKMTYLVIKKLIKKATVKSLEHFQAFYPDIKVDHNFSLSEFGIEGSILHLPGHTDGSIGILFEDGSFICGDIFCNTSKPEIAPNAVDFKELNQSIKQLNSYKITTVYPGHGSPFDYASLK